MSMVRQAERPYTAENLAGMPDYGRKYEVIGGELIVSSSPSERHQRILLRLAKLLDDYFEGNDGAHCTLHRSTSTLVLMMSSSPILGLQAGIT
ncbi:hypothetical protein BH23CHL4_BH23CHL4_03480 [soil metagenome]